MNRNYLYYPAQTNLELYLQLMDSKYYQKSDIEIINKAYYFCLNKVYNIYRGSGKPFLAHLVGTSSILISQNTNIAVVVAALMHAIYQRRVSFPEASDLNGRRDVVKKMFGEDIEKLIFCYTEYENSSFEVLLKQLTIEPHFQKVLLMRLADELEDLSYCSIFMHGLPGDNQNVKGGYLWRKENKAEEVNRILALLKDIGISEFAEAFIYWINTDNYPDFPESIKSGYYSSFSI